MKTNTCVCGQLIFFQNVTCVACGRELGFLPDVLCLSSLEPVGDGSFKASNCNTGNRTYKKCQNYAMESVCNWMIPVGAKQGQKDDAFCASCQLNQTIPDLSRQQNHDRWARMELAKRRLLYSLNNLKLPVANKMDDPAQGLAFAFLEDEAKPDGSVSKVLIGHDNGLVTMNIAEADDDVREKSRIEMGEPQRTLLGHFRHEIGHYYWDRLVRGTKFLEPFRELFGDERADYEEALKRYYSGGAPANWRDNHISAYATAHPWEDWAESWAHFLNIQDSLEVANDFSLVGKSIGLDPNRAGRKSWLSTQQKTFEEIIGAWVELTVALNSIDRSMGLPDTYPYVLSRAAVNKLGFIYEVVSAESARSAVAAHG